MDLQMGQRHGRCRNKTCSAHAVGIVLMRLWFSRSWIQVFMLPRASSQKPFQNIDELPGRRRDIECDSKPQIIAINTNILGVTIFQLQD